MTSPDPPRTPAAGEFLPRNVVSLEDAALPRTPAPLADHSFRSGRDADHCGFLYWQAAGKHIECDQPEQDHQPSLPHDQMTALEPSEGVYRIDARVMAEMVKLDQEQRAELDQLRAQLAQASAEIEQLRAERQEWADLFARNMAAISAGVAEKDAEIERLGAVVEAARAYATSHTGPAISSGLIHFEALLDALAALDQAQAEIEDWKHGSQHEADEIGRLRAALQQIALSELQDRHTIDAGAALGQEAKHS